MSKTIKQAIAKVHAEMIQIDKEIEERNKRKERLTIVLEELAHENNLPNGVSKNKPHPGKLWNRPLIHKELIKYLTKVKKDYGPRYIRVKDITEDLYKTGKFDDYKGSRVVIEAFRCVVSHVLKKHEGVDFETDPDNRNTGWRIMQ